MLRTCSACGRVDDHPRHVVGMVNRPGTWAWDLKRMATSMHLDCCAQSGCALCLDSLDRAGGLSGQALIDHLAAERAARTLED